MKEDNNKFNEYLIKAMNNAIKDELFNELMGITIDWNDTHLTMLTYIEGNINDEIIEHIDNIDTYFLSHMPDKFTTEYKVKQVLSERDMKPLKIWVYKRNSFN